MPCLLDSKTLLPQYKGLCLCAVLDTVCSVFQSRSGSGSRASRSLSTPLWEQRQGSPSPRARTPGFCFVSAILAGFVCAHSCMDVWLWACVCVWGLLFLHVVCVCFVCICVCVSVVVCVFVPVLRGYDLGDRWE